MLSRNVRITSFRATVLLNAIHPKGDAPYVEGQRWLELRATAQEPVKGVSDVKINLWLREKVEIGAARHGMGRREARRTSGNSSLR